MGQCMGQTVSSYQVESLGTTERELRLYNSKITTCLRWSSQSHAAESEMWVTARRFEMLLEAEGNARKSNTDVTHCRVEECTHDAGAVPVSSPYLLIGA